jgi:hypothetical protein
MFDLQKPIGHYGYSPFFAGAALCFIGVLFAFSFKKPAADKSPGNIGVGL